MEKSIKRVEKLVHATSSALAQMKFSLMFDDMNGGKSDQAGRTEENFHATVLDKLFDVDDLNLRQKEFSLEANETLSKLDKISTPNELSGKNLKPLDRIKEINRKMNYLKLEQSKRGETKQSRQKLLSLINEKKFSPGMNSCKESVESKQIGAFPNEDKDHFDKVHASSRQRELASPSTKSPIKSEAELKNKILETQEIVDRGFQTARHLAQKVESMTKWDRKDRTPSTGKTVSEINLRSLEGKTESNETVKTVKCRRHSGKHRRRERDSRQVEQFNTQMIDIKRNEFEGSSRSNLQLQHLPSLHIRGGLKVQKIHNLEIPASEEVRFEKSNTGISFLSHEQMEREKMEKLIEKVKKENSGYLEDEGRTKYIECFNCGKLIGIRETCVDPRKIDEVLRRCDFNVFDPRIDEFVEKYGGADAWKRCEEIRPAVSDAVVSAEPEDIPKDVGEIQQKKIKEEEEPKRSRGLTLRDLSDQLCKRYKEEADSLADNHLKLDAILRNLFRKVEESREVFETCYFLRNYKSESGKESTLTTTKPVLVTLPGVSSFVRNTQKKLDKKDVKNRSKSRTELSNKKEFALSPPPPSKSAISNEKTQERVLSFIHTSMNQSPQRKTNEEPQRRFFGTSTWENEPTKHSEIDKLEAEELSLEASTTSHSSSSSYKAESNSREKKIKKTIMMASVQRKSSKFLENLLPVGSPTSRNKTAKPLENKKEEIEESRPPSVTSSFSSSRSGSRNQMDFGVKNLSPIMLHSSKKEVERKPFVASPSKNSNVDKEEEKSENNYESDFESFTNEPEEKVDECEDAEPEMNPVLKKLFTISEVDSELEKKLSDDQNTSCLEEEKKIEFVRQENNSAASGISTKSKKTQVTPTKTAETSLKSTPTELVTSLKDILSALQNQFARTESLAEKLTENSALEKKGKGELDMAPLADAILNPWTVPTAVKLVENLQSSRKDWSPGPKTRSGRNEMFEGVLSTDGASEGGGSSLGEIIVSEGRKNGSKMTNNSSISEDSILNLASMERSL